MKKDLYHHTGKLVGFIFKRDRIRLLIWILSISLLTFAVASAFTDLYATSADRQIIAETMLNPAMTAMVGQGYGLDNYTNGAMMAHQMLLFSALAVALMSILLVVRHTRADEEDGQTELIGSLPVGRLSHITATIIVGSATNIILALVVGFGLFALQIESMNLAGSLLYGAALGTTGIFFTALTSVLAQVLENSRNTIGLAVFSLLTFYGIRAIGDVSYHVLSWFSPLGWILGTEVYVTNYWWPLILTLSVSSLFIVLALYLNSIRDLGSAFFHVKPGKTKASATLLNPFGIAVRLQRTTLISWAIGIFVLGAAYGSVLGDLESFFESIEIMESMLPNVPGFSLTEQFITMLISIMAMISTVPALMMVIKVYGEEKKGRTEHLLSRAISRTRLMSSYLVLAIITAFTMLSLAAIGLWSVGLTVMKDPIPFNTFYLGALAYLPAILVMIGITLLLIGLVPRLTGMIWIYLVYSFVVVYLGGLLQFPDWMSKISPYGYIPAIPIEEVDIVKIGLLTLIGVVISIVGFIGYNKRDIEG